MSNLSRQKSPIAITGSGLLTGAGFGVEANWAETTSVDSGDGPFSLKSFPVARHLSDRKLMKVVSLADAFGLAAFEQAMSSGGIVRGRIDPWTIGIYVGAQPSRLVDNENYNDAINETRSPEGRWSELKFGRTMTGARPTSLLQGLPNNVLCYGAILADGRGPNSNYTTAETSGLVALVNAVRRLRRGQISVAVAGGYGAQLDPVQTHITRQAGNLASDALPLPFEGKGTRLGDAASFLILETEASAKRRNASSNLAVVGIGMASDGGGPVASRVSGDGALAFRNAVVEALRQCAEDGGFTLDQVGMLMPSATGIQSIDAAELGALNDVFGHQQEKPALAGSTRRWGNVMEAGGVGEIAMAFHLWQAVEVPESWRVLPTSMNTAGFTTRWSREKSIAIVFRSTPWGEVAAVAVEVVT